VHFGDSYAAELGTQPTSGDDCRVGSNNYGNLLNTWLRDTETFDYEIHACSGDTTDGLNHQIDEWLKGNPKSTTMGTLTIGGNDVGFSELVRNCFLIIWYSSIDSYRQSCIDSESRAWDLMQTPGDTGIEGKLSSAYRRIMDGANSVCCIR
jgi:hypothetical protein